MKKLVFVFVSLFIVVIAAQNVNAQNGGSATAISSATIIAPLSIKKDVDLVFGDIVRSATAGTVTISTEGTRTPDGGVIEFTPSNTTPSAAQFTVNGEKGYAFSITVTESLIVSNTNGEGNMKINKINTTPPAKLSDNGTQIIKVGGTLNVGANQASGLYKNEDGLKVTVAYN